MKTILVIRFLGLIAVLVTLPSQAAALEIDFYTYGGFQETVDAFRRVALIFDDDSFSGIFYVFAVLGIFIGYVIHSGNQVLSSVDGQARPSLRVIFTVAIGIAIYQGTVISKGRVTVYDHQLNQFETVTDVPDILVLSAGFTNLVERAVNEVIDNNAATPYKDYAGGLNFKLIHDAVSKTSSFKQFYAVKSLQRFYQDCSTIPLSTNTSTFNLETLKSGTKDTFGYLENLKRPSTYTVFYTSTNKEGGLVSCSQAYDLLKPIYETNASYDEYIGSVCESNGFDSGSVLQLNRCKEIITKFTQDVYGDNTLDYMALMKNVLVGMAITDAVQQENPDIATSTISNRAMVNEGIGTSVAANNWLPTIRSVVTAIILSVTPILLLFVVTGLVWKTLNIIFSLYAWVAIWGICDNLLQHSIMDQTYALFSEVVSHDMGLTAIMLTPGAAMKSLSIMGEARGMGITIASFISIALFRMNAYAFSQIGQNFTNQINRHGEQASNTANNAEQSGQLSEQIVGGSAYLSSMSNTGFDSAYSAAAFSQTSQIMTGASMSGNLGGGNPFSAAARSANVDSMNRTKGVRQGEMVIDGLGGSSMVAAEKLASVSAGAQVGNVRGTEGAAMPGANLFESTTDTAKTETEKRIGDSQGIRDSASTLDMKVSDLSHTVSETDQTRRFGESQAYRKELETAGSGGSRTVAEASQNIALTQSSDLLGKLDATKGNAAPYIDMSSQQNQQKLIEWGAFMSTFSESGIDPLHAAYAKGAMTSLHDQGNAAAYAHVDNNDVMVSQFDSAMRGVFKGKESFEHFGISQYPDYESFYGALGEHSALMESASAMNFLSLAESAGIDPSNLAMAMTGKAQLALTGDQAKGLHEQGMLTDKQYSALQEGGNIEMSHIMGNVLSSSAHSGDSASVDNSYSQTSDHTVSSVETNRSGRHYQDGLQLADDPSVRSYMDNVPALSNTFSRIYDGDLNERDTLAQRAADTANHIVNTNRSLSESSNAGMKFGAGAGKGSRSMFDAGGSVSFGGQDVEIDTYNSTRSIMLKAVNAITDYSHNYTANRIGTDSEYFEKARSEHAGELMKTFYED